MKIETYEKNVKITPSLYDYMEKKFTKFDKYLTNEAVGKVSVEVKNNGTRHKIKLLIIDKGKDFVAETSQESMYNAIDELERIMTRNLRKNKEKLTKH